MVKIQVDVQVLLADAQRNARARGGRAAAPPDAQDEPSSRLSQFADGGCKVVLPFRGTGLGAMPE